MSDALVDIRDAPPGAVTWREASDLRAWFDAEVSALVAPVPPGLTPLRIPKRRLADALGCTLRLVHGPRDAAPTAALLLGRLLDAVVHHHVLLGAVADPWAVAWSSLIADADRDLPAVEDLPAEERELLRAELIERAAGLEEWGEIDDEWWPRCESAVSVALADRRVVAAGRFDLELGGHPSDRPHVIVEVKSGRSAPRQRDDAFWYALLATLRDGRAPDWVLTWTAADRAVLCEPVRTATLETAAHRALDALSVLVSLELGAAPEATPGPMCGSCGLLVGCAPGTAQVAGGEAVAW